MLLKNASFYEKIIHFHFSLSDFEQLHYEFGIAGLYLGSLPAEESPVKRNGLLNVFYE